MNSAATPTASLAQQAYEMLEEKLVTLALPPGKQLSEGQLMELTGFGRTPLREAVLRLAQQEFFLIMPRKGLVVTPVNRASMVLIIEARKPIERIIVYRAALNAMDTQRSEIAAIARKLTISHDSFEDFLKLDQELGVLFDTCAGNAYASAAVSPMRGHCRRFWYHHRHQMQLSDAISAHSKMARLVARREYNGAQKASDGVIAVLERLVASVDR